MCGNLEGLEGVALQPQPNHLKNSVPPRRCSPRPLAPPTAPTPPGQTAPPPTSTNPQDGPLGVVAPSTIALPQLPPVGPGGSPIGVNPPPGWGPQRDTPPVVTPQSWEDFVRWLQALNEYAQTLEQELRHKTDEQLAQMGGNLADKLANRSAELLKSHAEALIRQGKLPEAYRAKVEAVLDFVKTWQDPKEQLSFTIEFAAVVIAARGVGSGGVSLDRMAEVAWAGLQAKQVGGKVRDPSGGPFFDAAGYKGLLQGYVDDVSTLLSPEYQRRANQQLGGAVGFVAGFNPLVGTITGIYGALTGRDLFTGQSLSTAERVTGVISFGRVAKALGMASRLDRNLGGKVGDGLQAHHLIPQELFRTDPALKRAVRGGFDMDASYNGLLIPTTASDSLSMGMPFHRGSHPNYTQSVQRELYQLQTRSLIEGWSDARVAQEVRALAGKLAHEIQSKGGGVSLNQAFR